MSTAQIALVAAISDNGVIGSKGGIPWRLPDDQRFFKRLTIGHSIIMGRATWDSIGRLLPKRTTVVVSRQRDLSIEGAFVAHDFDDAIGVADRQSPERETGHHPSILFVVGGAALYECALPVAQVAYVTRVHAQIEGDTLFTAFCGGGPPGWDLAESEPHATDADHAISFTIETWRRRGD